MGVVAACLISRPLNYNNLHSVFLENRLAVLVHFT